MTPPISIIIPTFNNPQFLNPCVLSILRTGVVNGLAKLIIVNNGQQPIEDTFRGIPNFQVLNPGKNLGWERGLQYGIENTDSPFLVFQNDDTHIPKSSAFFYNHLIRQFEDENVAAVGPATTNAAGWHSVFLEHPVSIPTEVSYLIFFTVMVRRSHYDLVGGLDVECPGGDDLDLSIRFRKLGKKLMVQPDAFLIHHGFKTGERVRGGPSTPDGWNSKEMTDRTNQWLIQKHGFKTVMQMWRGLPPKVKNLSEDIEGNIVASYVQGERIVELGCGAKKTVKESVGVDMTPPGVPIANLGSAVSVADVVADVRDELPFPEHSQDTIIARHILEHCIDTIATLRNWNRILKIGGRLVIAVPDEEKIKSIPMNPEHVHAFTRSSLRAVLETCGFKETFSVDTKNGISFVAVYEKVDHPAKIESQEELILSGNGKGE